MNDMARVRRGQLIRSQNARMKFNPDSEIAWPTLAHVPGVEIGGKYRTKCMGAVERPAIHGALKKPRLLFASPTRQAQVIHLGGGRVLFQ